MSDILSIDYSLLSASLTQDEIALLQQYKTLALNLNSVKNKLDEINTKMTHVDESNTENLTTLSTDLQKSLGVLSTVFKSTVHNVLLHVDSNQLLKDVDVTNATNGDDELRGDIDSSNLKYKKAKKNANTNTNSNANNKKNISDSSTVQQSEAMEIDENDDDLVSGLDEETLNAVGRFHHDLVAGGHMESVNDNVDNNADDNSNPNDVVDEVVDDADIHRQIAHQLEISNPEDY